MIFRMNGEVVFLIDDLRLMIQNLEFRIESTFKLITHNF
ncbi:MAG: hypothetical protein TRG1_2780 [Flavobacteriaceae bacterium FS1-H7996/R]|nr:MAG: hypothetical protein TRG1_2780 [Flavobacteriaceae bacterium FS1-H7996/R]